MLPPFFVSLLKGFPTLGADSPYQGEEVGTGDRPQALVGFFSRYRNPPVTPNGATAPFHKGAKKDGAPLPPL